MKRTLQLTVLLIAVIACSKHQAFAQLSYLALGDSYTVGESVPQENSWPYQLARSLADSGHLYNVEVIAKTGWRTDELMAAVDSANLDSDYDLVSLSIGVNNQYQSRPFELYDQEFNALINMALDQAGNDKQSVFVVGIPDYGSSPFADSLDSQTISREILTYNRYARLACERQNILFINVYECSRNIKDEWFASDGLHPSAKQYAAWTKVIIDQLLPRLKYLD